MISLACVKLLVSAICVGVRDWRNEIGVIAEIYKLGEII